MISEVFITCALTGAGNAVERSPHVPVTPQQIAQSAIEAARAGAAVVHIHVRDPTTRRGSRDPALYRAVVERIRESDVNPVINLTAGMGNGLVLGEPDSPLPPNPTGTDMAGVRERLVHVEELRPEICTLDCGSMNWGAGSQYVMVNTAGTLRAMAARVKELGVRPELEVFDAGQLVLVRDLIKEGLINDPALIQLCMGIRYGAPDDPTTLLALIHQLPPQAIYSVFSIGRMQLPYAALAPLVGANVRVGLEDNIYLSRGRLATNAELTQQAVEILERMGVRVMSPDQVRQKLTVSNSKKTKLSL
ncbi:3-keto-5-aminohexanoate cleavage protein [Bradyrhizobium sp. 197]|uniref:3-keto-5-aminohexanoate cleavage protein n=1 Tax=unclassified Bradyrhizobium TaxID=2631580 RepID=UPI00037E8D82|nr:MULTISPECIES: 3-keto-5-aminohexanoate cleavage protein [unclassified Bradyrhizobium]MCK1478317.1 3-keto-5-aminohexanoate cleavage protein [Bradyrhizobium sp. 197]